MATMNDFKIEIHVGGSLAGLRFSESLAHSLCLSDDGVALPFLVNLSRYCSLQCDQQQLGNMYGVLSRRRGRVVDEDLVEGTQVAHSTSLPERLALLCSDLLNMCR